MVSGWTQEIGATYSLEVEGATLMVSSQSDGTTYWIVLGEGGSEGFIDGDIEDAKRKALEVYESRQKTADARGRPRLVTDDGYLFRHHKGKDWRIEDPNGQVIKIGPREELLDWFTLKRNPDMHIDNWDKQANRVQCGHCGWMTENLVSHIQTLHPEVIERYRKQRDKDEKKYKKREKKAADQKPVKGIAIYPDKRVEEVTIGSYKDYQQIVQGYIEPVTLSDGSTMYVNEEFLYSFGPDAFNSIASDVAGLGGRQDLMLTGILGPVVIVGPLSRSGYSTDVTDTARRWVQRVKREAAKQAQYPMNLNTDDVPDLCPKCLGSGNWRGENDCPTCDGLGYVEMPQNKVGKDDGPDLANFFAPRCGCGHDLKAHGGQLGGDCDAVGCNCGSYKISKVRKTGDIYLDIYNLGLHHGTTNRIPEGFMDLLLEWPESVQDAYHRGFDAGQEQGGHNASKKAQTGQWSPEFDDGYAYLGDDTPYELEVVRINGHGTGMGGWVWFVKATPQTSEYPEIITSGSASTKEEAQAAAWAAAKRWQSRSTKKAQFDDGLMDTGERWVPPTPTCPECGTEEVRNDGVADDGEYAYSCSAGHTWESGTPPEAFATYSKKAQYDDGDVTCPDCSGSGERAFPMEDDWGGIEGWAEVECSMCAGSGRVDPEWLAETRYMYGSKKESQLTCTYCAGGSHDYCPSNWDKAPGSTQCECEAVGHKEKSSTTYPCFTCQAPMTKEAHGVCLRCGTVQFGDVTTRGRLITADIEDDNYEQGYICPSCGGSNYAWKDDGSTVCRECGAEQEGNPAQTVGEYSPNYTPDHIQKGWWDARAAAAFEFEVIQEQERVDNGLIHAADVEEAARALGYHNWTGQTVEKKADGWLEFRGEDQQKMRFRATEDRPDGPEYPDKYGSEASYHCPECGSDFSLQELVHQGDDLVCPGCLDDGRYTRSQEMEKKADVAQDEEAGAQAWKRHCKQCGSPMGPKDRSCDICLKAARKTADAPIPFGGSEEEAQANYDSHNWTALTDDEIRCFNCDAKPWHRGAYYPCGTTPPRGDVPYMPFTPRGKTAGDWETAYYKTLNEVESRVGTLMEEWTLLREDNIPEIETVRKVYEAPGSGSRWMIEHIKDVDGEGWHLSRWYSASKTASQVCPSCGSYETLEATPHNAYRYHYLCESCDNRWESDIAPESSGSSWADEYPTPPRKSRKKTAARVYYIHGYEMDDGIPDLKNELTEERRDNIEAMDRAQELSNQHPGIRFVVSDERGRNLIAFEDGAEEYLGY